MNHPILLISLVRLGAWGQSDEPKREDRECKLTDALQQTGNPSGRMCDIDELEMTYLIDATAAAKPHVTGFLVIYVAP